uniref:Uncharacterized protein n=1 Tax=Cacopsylla melanoneura TaxID=428564 RepID=A0A8D8Y3L6_9HEMI
MSKSHLYLRTGFPRAPLANGLGRYMCQVKRMTVKFCKSHGSSRGVSKWRKVSHVISQFQPGRNHKVAKSDENKSRSSHYGIQEVVAHGQSFHSRCLESICQSRYKLEHYIFP